MHIVPIPTDDASLERLTRELWLPYNRELARQIEAHGLCEETDIVPAEVEFRSEWLESEDNDGWVAIEADDPAEDAPPRVAVDGTVRGFITTQVDTAPSVFTRPDRLIIGDLYVEPSARGTGLAEALVERAVDAAVEAGCEELSLDVDVENDRARAFYRRLGFATIRHQMTAQVTDIELDRSP